MVKFLIISALIIAVLLISSLITAWAIRKKPGLQKHRTGLFWSIAAVLGLIAGIVYKKSSKADKDKEDCKDTKTCRK